MARIFFIVSLPSVKWFRKTIPQNIVAKNGADYVREMAAGSAGILPAVFEFHEKGKTPAGRRRHRNQGSATINPVSS
jgi:hypothetical protein